MPITIKNLQKKIPISPTRIKKTIRKVLSRETKKRLGEITVCFVNDATIKKFNLKFLHKNFPTDVISFDMTTENKIYADIIISTDTAIKNAKIFKTTPDFETETYVVHGLLHTLGYDDLTKKQKALMTKKERSYVHP